MNRPGQPPQRPPSLAPPTSLSSQFRSPYPTSQYPMPQRGFPAPALQQQQNPHRTPAVPQSPFLPTRQQAQASNFPFGAGAGVLGQNGASSLPPHMSPNPPAATTASAPSVSSTSEVVFDLNEFPALGSLSQSNNNTNASSTTNVDSTMSSSAPGSSTNNAPASNTASFTQPSSQLPSQPMQTSSQGQQAHNSNSNDNGPNQPQNQAPSLQQQQHLGAPPGVPPLGVLQNVSNGNHHIQPTPHSLSHLHGSVAQSQSQLRHHPQTPAQQVLISAADRWGLVGLLAMIKNSGADPDGGLSSIGTDLGAIGLDMAYEGNLYSTFITPWADQSAARSVEPDFHLPPCYNVQPPPPGPSKAAAFSDETLFYMFYSSPRDALQEVAAQELWNRNWRYHKDLRTWITKESGSAPSTKIPGGEVGIYTWWDPESWCKDRKEMTVRYADLEEKTAPAFAMGPGLVLTQPQSAQGQQQGTIGQQTVAGQGTTQPRMQVAGI
ncbi:hypothetical protein BKA83DRAFT_4392277 [Pisolithus microcarpus]|nr:hypothetical protein BKA83DRAFT_4392277 [Pisolithus microcarpus]